MSIVLASAAFDEDTLQGAKLSIIIASAISATVGLFILNWAVKSKTIQ